MVGLGKRSKGVDENEIIDLDKEAVRIAASGKFISKLLTLTHFLVMIGLL